jgi:hypothetical protein
MELRVAKAMCAQAALDYDAMLDKSQVDKLSRAAIRVMLEPTEEMWTAGANKSQTADGTASIWQAMIDAASPPEET